MPFKNLCLNQETFDTILNNYPNLTSFTKNIKPQLTQYSIIINEKEVLVNVYFKKDGTTTISPKVGKEQELSNNIAIFLKDSLSFSNIEQVNFSTKNISNDNFELLKEYLKDCKIEEILINEINGKKTRHSSKYQDSITITRYNNGNTQFQGKPLYVFSEIRNFLIDILEINEIINFENQVYKVAINIDDIKEELSVILPKSYSYICSITQKMLSSALTLKKIDVELEDYTAFAFPALRGLESYLKIIFMEKGVTFNGNGFNHFDKSNGRYSLKDEHKTQINCNKTINCIEKCYNYFNTNRHPLFHASNISSTSRLLTNKNDAIIIVDTVLKLIEETHNERLSS